jgi:RND family efflux transporter MFP subunit
LQQAERDWKRLSSLYNQQAATRADFDAADSRLQLAQAGVSEARAMLDYVEVKAPFDGVVTRKVADIGDLASPGKPLVELEDPTRLQLEADVPEAISGRIKPGARMAVHIEKADSELTGIVVEIAPNADPLNRTLRVKLDLPDDHGLMSGQFARLAVPVGELTSLRVPATALVQRGQMEIVFAVENQRARLHLVKTGRQLKDETEILSGLDSGDSVVVENAGLLLDGQPVTQ